MKREIDCLRINGDEAEASECCVALETPLSITVNGRPYATAMISPEMQREFVLGHLFSEGIIKSAGEVQSLDIEGSTARVLVENPMRAILSRRPIVSGCGGAASFLDESKLPRIESNIKVGPGEIAAAMAAISRSEVHEATGGVHSVGIFPEFPEGRDPIGRDPIICEDIGRHSALDKTIGRGLVEGLRFDRSFAASTGRISSEMALKCSNAGIPLIASRGATTALAVEIAEKTGLTIVGFARGGRMNVYSNVQRLRLPKEGEK